MSVRMRLFPGLVALMSVAALGGCGAISVRTHVDLSQVVYQQDPRTHVCYAVLGHAKGAGIPGAFGISAGFTITYVPCTDYVLSAVQEDSSNY